MIKKSIASILVLLIIINSIGCYSKAYLPKKELDKLSEGDNIIVTTKDRKAYDIRVVRIIGSDIHGIEYRPGRPQIVIKSEEISTIETKKLDAGKTIIFGIVCIGVIAGTLSMIAVSQLP